MSIALMTIAFRAKVPSTQKLVLLALCDSANEQGECYPSVSILIGKCSLSERAVQGAMMQLEAAGHLRREHRKGRSTIYWMTPHERDTPAANAPRSKCPPHVVHPTPARGAPPPPHVVPPTPAPRAPITITEPSIEPSRKQKTARPAPAVVHSDVLIAAGFDPTTADDFIAHKARIKAPLTERAWSDHLRESAKAGWTPQAAAEKVMARNWKGFDAEYVKGQGKKEPSLSFAERAHNAACARVHEMTGGLAAAKPIGINQPEVIDADPFRLRPLNRGQLVHKASDQIRGVMERQVDGS